MKEVEEPLDSSDQENTDELDIPVVKRRSFDWICLHANSAIECVETLTKDIDRLVATGPTTQTFCDEFP